MDSNSPGNYGLLDIIAVLKYVKKYISIFGGDANKVTMVGSGSGAAAISLLLLSGLAIDNGNHIHLQI